MRLNKALFFVFLFFMGYAAPMFSENGHFQDILEMIFQHAKTSIQCVENEKIYLKPDKIQIFEGKIYLESDKGELVGIPYLRSNDTGLFLKNKNYKTQPMWICKACTWTHYYEPQECERCHGKAFIVRYQ